MPAPISCPSCSELNFITEGAAATCSRCGSVLSSSAASGGGPNPFAAAAPAARRPASDNPYQAPTAAFETQESYSAPTRPLGRAPAARRFTRWLGAMIDSMFFIVILFVTLAVTSPKSTGPQAQQELNMLILMAVIGVTILQSLLVMGTGQTIGKMILGTKIVNNADDSQVGFLHGVFLRQWILVPISMIPFVGGIFGLVDALCIFGEESRCLHDMIAGTRVINIRG